VDGVSYLRRNGCSWRILPREYPPWQTVYHHFRRWRIDGPLRRAHDRPREEARETEGREPDPGAAVIDGQFVKSGEEPAVYRSDSPLWSEQLIISGDECEPRTELITSSKESLVCKGG
jgi:putative transposase